jgi:MFS family permease
MRGLWRLLAAHRDYRLLATAHLVSALGDYLLGVGLVYLVYDLTGSTLASAGMLVVSVLPQALLASAAGVLADRWDRRRTLATCSLLQVAILVPLLFVTDDRRIWLLYVVAGGQALVEQLSFPAEQALVPHLVPDDDLVSANAVNGQAATIARLVGGSLGGVTAAWGGLPALAVVDAITFAVAAALVFAIRPQRAHAPVDPDAEPAPSEPWWTQWRAGLRVAMGSRTLKVLLVFEVGTAVGEGVMGTLFAPFVRDVLHGGAQAYGFVSGIQAVGGVLGGLAVAAYASRIEPVRLLAMASVAFGAIDLAIFLSPLAYVSVWPALVMMAVVGVPGAAVVASFTTLLQRGTTDAYRGRVFGTLLGLQSVGVLAGSLLAGWLGGLGDSRTIVAVIAWQGAGYVLLGLVVAATLGGRPAERPAGEQIAARPADVSA